MATFEHIIVESKGAVGIVTRTARKCSMRLSFGYSGNRRRRRRPRGRRQDRMHPARGQRKAFAAGADIKEMQPNLHRHVLQRFCRRRRRSRRQMPQADDRRRQRLCARRRAAELAMMCDIIIAADTRNSAQPRNHARHHPGIGGTQR